MILTVSLCLETQSLFKSLKWPFISFIIDYLEVEFYIQVYIYIYIYVMFEVYYSAHSMQLITFLPHNVMLLSSSTF